MTYDKKWHREHRQKLWQDPVLRQVVRDRNNANRRKVLDWLAAYKLERGCADCGYKKFACALQLDHMGPKSVAIGAARTSIKRLKKEIEEGKCAVRCANCHAVRHWGETHDTSGVE